MREGANSPQPSGLNTMSKIKTVISNIVNISPVYIQLRIIEKDTDGITVIFDNLLFNKTYVMEMTLNFRLLSYYPI